MAKFELVFVGGISRRYRRWHKSFEAAQALAIEILYNMGLNGDPAADQRAAHPAIIYGPGCGRDGVTVP